MLLKLISWINIKSLFHFNEVNVGVNSISIVRDNNSNSNRDNSEYSEYEWY